MMKNTEYRLKDCFRCLEPVHHGRHETLSPRFLENSKITMDSKTNVITNTLIKVTISLESDETLIYVEAPVNYMKQSKSSEKKSPTKC